MAGGYTNPGTLLQAMLQEEELQQRLAQQQPATGVAGGIDDVLNSRYADPSLGRSISLSREHPSGTADLIGSLAPLAVEGGIGVAGRPAAGGVPNPAASGAKTPEWISRFFTNKAAQAGTPDAAARIAGIGGKLARGARVLAPIGVGVGTLMTVADSASKGSEEAGGFGAVNRGGQAAAGAGIGAAIGAGLGFGVATPITAPIGAIIGGMIGDATGSGTNRMAQRMSEGTGPIAELLDPFIESPTELAIRQQNDLMQQQYDSPMARMMRDEQARRSAQQRADMAQQVMYQILAS